MPAYSIELQTLWQGAWLPLGNWIVVEDTDPAAAVARVRPGGLRHLVQYRYLVLQEDGTEQLTAPASWPDPPGALT